MPGYRLNPVPLARLGAHAIANLRDPVMGRAHEPARAQVSRCLQHSHDFIEVLEAHRLLARLFLGHVIDAEELIIAE